MSNEVVSQASREKAQALLPAGYRIVSMSSFQKNAET